MPDDATRTDVFISHVEEDSAAALQISDALESAGYSTWCYERDSVPGPSYLLQTADAIDRSKAVVVLVSPHSMGSNQMTKEVVRGHQSAKPFLPVLLSVSQAKFAGRQPEWIEAIGESAAIEVPRGGIKEALPRVVAGVEALDLEASGEPGRKVDSSAFISAAPRPTPARAGLRPWHKAALAALAVAVLAGAAVIVISSGGDGDGGGDAAKDGLNPAKAPLETVQGQAEIADTHLAKKFCYPVSPAGGEACIEPASGSFFVMTLEESEDASLENAPVTFAADAFYEEANKSYLMFDGRKYEPESVDAGQAADGAPAAAIAYDKLPASVAGEDVELHWPENETFIIHVPE